MKVVFDNLANFLSISPNQTPVFAVCLPGPSWTFMPFLFLPILYSLPYILYNVHVLTPTCTVCDQLLWIYGYSCTHAFLLWGPNTHFLNNFPYSLFKYCIILLHCQLLKICLTILSKPDLAQWLHTVWGPGGWRWWGLVTQQADKLGKCK